MRKNREKRVRISYEIKRYNRDFFFLLAFSSLLYFLFLCFLFIFFPSKDGLKIIKSDKSMFAAHNKRKIVNGSYIINILLKRRKR